MNIGHKKQTTLSFSDAVAKAREALQKEGFGVISEIDAKQTFKNKLDVDFENYLILGACHPESALKVLQTDKELGLLLPCNVLVYEDKGIVFVSAIMPKELLQMLGNNELAQIAEDIENKLQNVIEQI